ncbi:vWA domain-containing protein [Salinibacillus xinjiangensis]|uniref:VWA domain-containing protein n=1 Tax=Salinibacillus xinjiangensis TaxID=1229268 RepID=A0A6G1X8F5_9BACI|nr:vWA domain-containing protein [Salinibacillus xinjiangensis]MRG87186.1 VWA domain-containing protein [Salinibacillus xinjiangensis]
MNSRLTEIIFLLDRSGSMSGLEEDTIGGFNALVERQCKLEGETILTTVLFNDDYEILWNGVDANQVKLTNKEYYVRGCTALLDAVGKTILDVRQRLSKVEDERRPGNVLFVITTDGMENASREFNYEKVKSLIQYQEENGWEFMFLGANIDAAKEAGSIGIRAENALQFEASSVGVEKLYDMVDAELSMKRANK